MTYLFKLVRRLAISRPLGLISALALLAACDGDTTAPDSPTGIPDDNPISLQVFPRSVTVETSQRVQFRGQTRMLSGEPVATPLVWRASGGSINPDGAFLSPEAGTYRIFARGHGWKHTDTAVVIVVIPQPGLARLTVVPKPASVEPGGTRAFSAKGFLRNGSAIPVGVNWSATGGVVDPSGVYTADSVPGSYQVIASNTAGTLADTATVTVGASSPTPTPAPAPPPAAPGHRRVILSPSRISLVAGGKQQYAVYGRTRHGDSVSIGVQYKAAGGTISSSGLYTAGPRLGTYKIIATSNGAADTALVTLSSIPAPIPLPTPTPAPPPIFTGKMGVPVGISGLLSAGVNPQSYTMSLDGYTADNIVRRLDEARSRNLHVLLNMTGGSHSNYVTGGGFDISKWRAKMNSYNTPAIKQAVAAAVSDGTIIGNSVMDEPQSDVAGKSWGGVMTKTLVDQMCGYVKGIFPSMAVGVVHDYSKLEPSSNYAVCDFIMSQYRLSKGPVDQYVRNSAAFAKRSHVSLIMSLNVLHGGTPGTGCSQYGDESRGTALCPMTPDQIRTFGMALGSAGCALNMWRFEPAYFNQPAIQAAVRDVAVGLARLPRTACVRS